MEKVFHVQEIKKDFAFNGQVAGVFDEMLSRSVPYYGENNDMIVALLDDFLSKNDRVYDLGCSTGKLLHEIDSKLESKKLKLIGVDQSQAMIEKARLRHYSSKVYFEKANISEFEFSHAGAVILNYTLQFLRPISRLGLLKKIYKGLKEGGALILCEKVISHDPLLNRTLIKQYQKFKKSQGYSDLEISKKREALENVLVPYTVEENKALLKEAGFGFGEVFFQWFNFASFVAVKESDNA